MSQRLRVSCGPVKPSELVREALARVEESRRELATRLGVTTKHVGLVLEGERGLGPEALIRVARMTQRRPLTVLRDYGQKKLADEIEATLGEPVTDAQRALLDRWDRLPPKIRLHLSGLIDASLGEESAAPTAAPRKKSSKKRR
jgi:hypothetical protein